MKSSKAIKIKEKYEKTRNQGAHEDIQKLPKFPKRVIGKNVIEATLAISMAAF